MLYKLRIIGGNNEVATVMGGDQNPAIRTAGKDFQEDTMIVFILLERSMVEEEVTVSI